MSDQHTPQAPATPPAPTTAPAAPPNGAQGGQVLPPQPGQPQAPSAQPQTPPAGEPYRVFNTEADVTQFVQGRVVQAKRAAVREFAKEFGYEDPEDLKDAIRAIRDANGGAAQGGSQSQPGEAPAPSQGPNEGQRLTMAVGVATKLGLPAALIPRLQGSTVEEMEADAQALTALLGAGNGAAAPTAPPPRAPGIPPAPGNTQPVTLTRSWLQANPKWVRDNRQVVERAYKEGRVVES